MLTKWKDYTKGEIIKFGFKLNLIMVRIDEKYFVDNFIKEIEDHKHILEEIDKIIIKNSEKLIELKPKNDDENFTDTIGFLSNNIISELYLVMGESYGLFSDTSSLEKTINDVKNIAKISIKYDLTE